MTRLLSKLLTVLLLCIAITVIAGESFLVEDFEHGLSPDWRVKEFSGQTVYEVVSDGSSHVLQAVSMGSASGLIYQKEFSLAAYQVVSWRWKIEAIVEKGDVSFRQSDDYAARVYVIFPHWFFPMTKSLNYIWANKLEKGRSVPSPYTSSSMMLAVESGSDNVGTWQTVRRNIADDFRQAFGTNPPDKFQIAIMTDTDNTGGKARAWYDDLRLEKE